MILFEIHGFGTSTFIKKLEGSAPLIKSRIKPAPFFNSAVNLFLSISQSCHKHVRFHDLAVLYQKSELILFEALETAGPRTLDPDCSSRSSINFISNSR